ncbi:MAG: hypothetical protein IJX83_04660 [Lachnospiraceae bacterium]|nr:hypothetical protein [Lachnospiraceae bacterium]
MNVFRYIILTCCAALDIGLFVFGVVGLFTFAGDPYPSVPIAMVMSWTLGALVLAGITGWSFYRTAKGKKLPVLYGFFWKIAAVMLVLSATWFSLEIPEAGWLALGIGAVLGALTFFLPKFWGSTQSLGPSQAQQRPVPAAELPVFRADKAEWAWEDAALEYFRLRGSVYDPKDSEQNNAFREKISAMQDSETDMIYDYAGMPIAYFLGWLIERDLVSEDFRNLHGMESLQSVKDETQTPVEVLRNMDYVLSRDDIDPKAYRLMDFYYNMAGTCSSIQRGSQPCFKHRSRKYFFDYYRAVCSRFDVPRYYCVDFSWERFHRLAQILDRRYREFCGSGFDDDELEQDGRMLRTQYFDSAAELLYEPGTSQEYVQMCADIYENMGDKLGRALAGELQEYCTEDLSGKDVVTEKILSHFHPQRVVVMKPVDEEIPAYMILGESEWEEEHGVAFTVIGDYVVDSSYYADAESPWSDKMIWEYRLQRDAEQGNFCEVDPVPAQFGGDNEGAGRIRMVVAAAQLKEEFDEMIEALFMLKMADKYDYKVVYDGKEPSYIFISALKNDMRTFADSIRLK